LENKTSAFAYLNTFLLLISPGTNGDRPSLSSPRSKTAHSHISLTGTMISALLWLQVPVEWSEDISISCLWLNFSTTWLIIYDDAKFVRSVDL